MLSAKKYRSLSQTLNYLPEELERVFVWCENCKAQISPPWLQKRPPLVVEPGYGGNWVPCATQFTCERCGGHLSLPVPCVKQTGGYAFFGDEAYREPSAQLLTTYSLIGTLNRDLNVLDERVRQLKRHMEPDRDPVTWKIHMKHIWSRRGTHPVFSNWSREKVRALCDGLFGLIRNYGDTLMVVNGSSVVHRPTGHRNVAVARTAIRNQVYLALILRVVDMATSSGVRPRFVFDGEVKRDDGTYAQPWAADLFQGAKLNLVFPFLAHGMLIEDAEVAAPGTYPGSELADFVSFTVARYLERRLLGKEVDLDPCNLGKVIYLGFTADGAMLRVLKDGYPWVEFFGSSDK